MKYASQVLSKACLATSAWWKYSSLIQASMAATQRCCSFAAYFRSPFGFSKYLLSLFVSSSSREASFCSCAIFVARSKAVSPICSSVNRLTSVTPVTAKAMESVPSKDGIMAGLAGEQRLFPFTYEISADSPSIALRGIAVAQRFEGRAGPRRGLESIQRAYFCCTVSARSMTKSNLVRLRYRT